MRVVITGGSGRLGQYVIRELFTRSYSVCSLDTIKPRECLCPTYTVDLNKVELLVDYFRNADAVVHLARIRFPYTETGYNPAAQRWEFSETIADARRLQQNIAMTNNVLVAAEAAGVGKLVCGSSLAVYGFYYPTTNAQPDYVPVDEEHPLRPQDPYGLTKFVGEKLCDAMCQRSEARIASLRFSGIYTEAHRSMLLQRKENPTIRGAGAMWSYIDARDAARACRLALEVEFAGHQVFNICAPTTIMETPTRELVERYLPRVKDFKDGFKGCASGYSTARAARVLGFEAKCSPLT